MKRFQDSFSKKETMNIKRRKLFTWLLTSRRGVVVLLLLHHHWKKILHFYRWNLYPYKPKPTHYIPSLRCDTSFFFVFFWDKNLVPVLRVNWSRVPLPLQKKHTTLNGMCEGDKKEEEKTLFILRVGVEWFNSSFCSPDRHREEEEILWM